MRSPLSTLSISLTLALAASVPGHAQNLFSAPGAQPRSCAAASRQSPPSLAASPAASGRQSQFEQAEKLGSALLEAGKEAYEALAGIFGALTRARSEAANVASVSNLKQIDLGLLMYVQDYDEILPPMKDLQTVQPLLMPYLKNTTIFHHPKTGEPYQPNQTLSRQALAKIDRPADTPAFFETNAAPDSTRAVAFVDGHVKRLSAEQWEVMEATMASEVARLEAADQKWLQVLRDLGAALRQYAARHRGLLPPMGSKGSVDKALRPYLKGGRASLLSWAYLPNPALSGKRLPSIRDPAATVALYQSAPAWNDTRAVLFLDGRAGRIPEPEWWTIRQRWNLP